jgi:hypothetical protein
MSFLTPVLVEAVKTQLISYETRYLITIICIMLVLATDLIFTTHRLNTARWLLGSGTIKQTITFRYEVSQNRSKLNIRTRARAIHMIN